MKFSVARKSGGDWIPVAPLEASTLSEASGKAILRENCPVRVTPLDLVGIPITPKLLFGDDAMDEMVEAHRLLRATLAQMKTILHVTGGWLELEKDIKDYLERNTHRGH